MRLDERAPAQTVPAEPVKHVIDEYHHRAQLVTCVCGWHGSTASRLGEKSPWDLHKAEHRTTRS